MRRAAWAVGVALMTVTLASTPAAGAPAKAPKPPKSCAVLTPDDLKLVFTQPWRKGTEEVGGACTFGRPLGTKWPNIEVAVIVEQKPSLRRARQAFARGERATVEIAEQVESIRKVGDEAYLTNILGADVLTFRSGRDLAEIRVHRIDKEGQSYRDQLLTVGDIVDARLHQSSKQAGNGGR
jgi:hypothetical protein